jgi:hypothetical protein
MLGWMQTSAFAGRNRRQAGGAGMQLPAEAEALLSAEVAELLPAEAADLQFMREEEKLARDVYLTFSDAYGTRVFGAVARAEQRHMDALLRLLDTYELEDTAQEEIGVFTNSELQELYDRLIEDGGQSEQDALMIGALIEEVDIEDLVESMARTDNARLLRVYGNLLNGSGNHLRAFVRALEALTDEAYTAQTLSQEEVDEILAQDSVRGQRRGQGRNTAVDASQCPVSDPAQEPVRNGGRGQRRGGQRPDWRSW